MSFGILGANAAMAQPPAGGAGGAGGAGQQQTQPNRPGDMANPNGPMANDTASGSAKADDKKFAKEAAMGGLMEVELGKVATQKASSDAVKQFGQRMVDDHTKANDELKQVASQDNLTLPTTLDKKHQEMVDKMSALSGPAFDKTYMKDMVKDHEKDVKEFQKESQSGTDPNIKSFATKTLPILQSHLESAKQIDKGAKQKT
jgi:putative membrane protein